MSISIDYFFNCEKNFEQLCEEMTIHLDFKFQSSQEFENHVYHRFLGMGFDFYIHDFENDRELKFEDYKYFLGVTIRSDVSYLHLSITAAVVNALYCQMKISKGMLVKNAETLLAKYEERFNPEIEGKGLFDEVSNKFVVFPEHLTDLDKMAWQ